MRPNYTIMCLYCRFFKKQSMDKLKCNAYNDRIIDNYINTYGGEDMKNLFSEFKAFITKGNVFALAIGIIIGGAFKAIITSFVADVLMPFISLILGNTNIAALKIVLEEATEEVPELAIRYGLFIQAAIDFIIIAVVIFLIVRVLNNVQKKAEEKPTEPLAPTKEEVLLTEIRDLLKEK